MTGVVFVGPSLPSPEWDDGDLFLRPPARMGDVHRAVLEGHRVIAIIDGYFERTPAVWHKEILFALSRGTAVIGGASMGALRAAELAAFGMEGIGLIYHDFAAGILEDDDEVAVVHASAADGYVTLSDAMANIRAGLAAAVAAGIIDPTLAADLVDRSKGRFYPDRSWAAVIADADAQAGAAAAAGLGQFLQRYDPNRKRDDAQLVIARARALLGSPPAAAAPTFDFEPSHYWENSIANAVALDGADGDTAASTFALAARAFSPDRRVLVREALLLHLAEREAQRLGLAPEQAATALSRFRRQHDLTTAAALQAWMRTNRLDRRAIIDLAQREAVVDQIAAMLSSAVDAQMPAASRMNGVYAEVLAATVPENERDEHLRFASPERRSSVVRRYIAEFGPLHGDINDHARAIGLDGPTFEGLLRARYPDSISNEAGA